jgi:multidrug efflux pump subunit AcrA (membrane-fusion protein)
MENKTIFRQSALEKLSSPEQLDTLMKVTTPVGWVALAAVGVMLLIAAIWGFVGKLPVRIAGQGILISPGGVQTLSAPLSGQMDDIYVEPGDSIKAGQVVARIRVDGQPAGAKVISAYSGQVIEIQAGVESLVERGDAILSLEVHEELGVNDLQAILYLAPADGKRIRPGMSVQLAPSTVKPEEYGYLLGRVISVGEFPATQQGMLQVLNNLELVKLLSTGGAPIEVRVDLVISPDQASGYAWTSPSGPPIELDSGTLTQAWITLSEISPINLLLPNLTITR